MRFHRVNQQCDFPVGLKFDGRASSPKAGNAAITLARDRIAVRGGSIFDGVTLPLNLEASVFHLDQVQGRRARSTVTVGNSSVAPYKSVSGISVSGVRHVCATASANAQTDRYEALANSPMVENRPTPETAKLLKDELLFQRASRELGEWRVRPAQAAR